MTKEVGGDGGGDGGGDDARGRGGGKNFDDRSRL